MSFRRRYYVYVLIFMNVKDSVEITNGRVRIQILEVDDNESSLCDDMLLYGILPS